MTIDEKRKALDEHCRKYLACDYGVSDECIDKQYNILFGKSELKQDNVNHPAHYESGKFECIEVMQEALGTDAVKDFCVCNAFKYICRHKRKNGKEDLQKAVWYINKYLELYEKE